MKWILRLYPRAWQQRYGEEMAAHLEHEPHSFGLLLDLLAGAFDAQMNPEWTPAASTPGEGESMEMTSASCGRSIWRDGRSRPSGWLIVAWSLILTLVSLALTKTEPILAEVTLYSAFPLAMVFAQVPMFSKGCSKASKALVLGGQALLIIAIILGGVLINNR